MCIVSIYDVEIICLQQRFIVLVKQGRDFPLSKVLACIVFFIIVKFITSDEVTKIFVSFKSNNGDSLSLGYICKMCQFVLIMCLISGRVLLKVTIKCIFFIVLCWVFIQNSIPGNSNSSADISVLP